MCTCPPALRHRFTLFLFSTLFAHVFLAGDGSFLPFPSNVVIRGAVLGDQTVPAVHFMNSGLFWLHTCCVSVSFSRLLLRGAFVTVFPPYRLPPPPLSFYFVIVTFHHQVDKQTVMWSCILFVLNNSFDAALKATPSSSNRAGLLHAGGRGRLLGAGAACGCLWLCCSDLSLSLAAVI